ILPERIVRIHPNWSGRPAVRVSCVWIGFKECVTRTDAGRLLTGTPEGCVVPPHHRRYRPDMSRWLLSHGTGRCPGMARTDNLTTVAVHFDAGLCDRVGEQDMSWSNPTVNAVYEQVLRRNPGEEEFHQAITEVFDSLDVVINKHPRYADASIL